MVLGGPFLPHIEAILRDKASSMSSPVISASDTGIGSIMKEVIVYKGRPCQSCDMRIQAEGDFKLFTELFDVNLSMLGRHQLQNAVTAACVALCLRDQGWRLSDESIRAGLENTYLLGRSQFLSAKEAEALGLSGATVLLDGAHTKESAKALMDMIQMTYPDTPLALVVAMANDKDHLGFARELLSGMQLEAVYLTEADIAGGKSRTTSPSLLRDCWIRASKELDINILHDEMAEYQELSKDQLSPAIILAAENSPLFSMRMVNQILRKRTGDGSGIIVVTGSLHIVSLVLASLQL